METLADFANWADRKADELRSPSFREDLARIRDELSASTYAGFQGSHDPDGLAWPRLRDRPFGKPLFGKKAVMVAKVMQAVQGAKITDTELLVEVSSEISAMHNVGKGRPKREHLGLGRNALEDAVERVADHAAAQIVKD